MTDCPSAAYLAIVRTRSGLTPEKPWRKILGVIDLPTAAEYEEWHLLAGELVKATYSHYVSLGDIETALREQDPSHGFPEWNRYVKAINDLHKALSDLPTVTDSWTDIGPSAFTWIEEVEHAVRVSSDAACLMEQIDLSILGYGLKPPVGSVSPKAPAAKADTEGMGILGSIAVVGIAAAAVGGAIYVSRRME